MYICTCVSLYSIKIIMFLFFLITALVADETSAILSFRLTSYSIFFIYTKKSRQARSEDDEIDRSSVAAR